MANLFEVLDGINSDSEFADANLASIDAIQTYAEACEISITDEQATLIQQVGQKWRADQENGNGEWSRMRHEAMAALEVKS